MTPLNKKYVFLSTVLFLTFCFSMYLVIKFVSDSGVYSKIRFALSISLSISWGFLQNLLKDIFRKNP